MPWVVVHGHRAIYYDCKHGANGTCAGTSPARGFGKDVEPLLFKYRKKSKNLPPAPKGLSEKLGVPKLSKSLVF